MRKRLVDAVLAAGSSQLFWYASLPLITRIYSKDSIGLFGQFLTYSGLIALVIGARADLAILTSRQSMVPVVRSAFIKLSNVLLLGVCLLGVVASAFLEQQGPLLSPVGGAMLLVGGLLASRFLIDGATLIKTNDYPALRRTALLRSLGQTTVQIALFATGVYGLLLGKLAGDTIGLLLRRREVAKHECVTKSVTTHQLRLSADERRALQANAKAYKYSFPQTLLNALSQGLPFIVLPAFVSLAWIGQYALAFMVVVAPIGLIAAPVRQMLLAEFSDERHESSVDEGSRRRVALRATGLLALVSVFSLVGLYLLADPLVRIVFGPGWGLAAEMMVLLWGWAGTGLIATPALAYLLAHDGNKAHLVIEAIQMVGRLLAILLGVALLDDVSLIIPFVAWSAVANIIAAAWVLRRRE